EMPREEHGVVRTLVAMLQLAIHYYHRITHTEHPYWENIRDDVLAELGIHPEEEHAYFEEISERFLA
ncbi:MAG TPA: histidine kinase, partial [Gallionella sp.]|nr:histidine kinase [Gallionella sp.]